MRAPALFAPVMLALAASSAFTLLAAPVGAQSSPSGPPHGKGEELSRARALDKEGAKAYGEGRYNDAIRYFEESYRLGGPAFELWNVAKCHLRLDQPEQAAELLERYLSMPNLPKEDRDEASQQLDSLKKRPSTITVSSTPTGAEVMVDGKSVEGRTPLSVTVTPGGHTVTVTHASRAPYTRQVEARYGRAVIVDATAGPSGQERPGPPPNPYDKSEAPSISVRASIGVMLPLHGSISGNAGVGFLALGTYRIVELGSTSIAVGGLVSIAGDSWGNRTGLPNEAPGCAPISNAQGAAALSLYGIGTASFPVTSKLRAVGMGGLGMAGYLAGDVGGDLFVPSCHPSPGLRPTFLLGAAIEYAITSTARLSAFPLTWQLQSAFGGARATPRDASGAWMRFGIGVGGGFDF